MQCECESFQPSGQRAILGGEDNQPMTLRGHMADNIPSSTARPLTRHQPLTGAADDTAPVSFSITERQIADCGTPSIFVDVPENIIAAIHANMRQMQCHAAGMTL